MEVPLLKAVPKSRIEKFFFYALQEGSEILSPRFVHYLTFVLQMIDREPTKLAADLYYCGK
jgi:hypothetical protein